MAKITAAKELRVKRTNKTIKTNFGDYKKDAHNWITLATGEFYPDILPQACELYKPVLVLFGQFIQSSESSAALFRQICEVSEGWMRVQLARVFRKYASPNTPVEMLKKKSLCEKIIEHFGREFRPIQEVQKAYSTRLIPDEALCAILWEYKDRGKKGYDLTAKLFKTLRERFPSLTVKGPEGAGKDILPGDILPVIRILPGPLTSSSSTMAKPRPLRLAWRAMILTGAARKRMTAPAVISIAPGSFSHTQNTTVFQRN